MLCTFSIAFFQIGTYLLVTTSLIMYPGDISECSKLIWTLSKRDGAIQCTVQLTLSKNLRDSQNLLAKTGNCLIQVHFNLFACFRELNTCLLNPFALKTAKTP